jgi:hypothetical protein
LIKEECILKNKNKLYPYKKLFVFYNSCLKILGRNLYIYNLLPVSTTFCGHFRVGVVRCIFYKYLTINVLI